MSSCFDNRPRASDWLVRTLSVERWYNDSAPKWKYLPSVVQAQAERIRRSRLLKKYGSAKLGSLLARCKANARCLSGCCPECGRALQRFFVSRANTLLDPHTDYAAVSIVTRTYRRTGKLASLPLEGLVARLHRACNKGRILIAIGGVDFSFNEHLSKGHDGRWVPQFWLLVHVGNRARWERAFRRIYQPRQNVPRPVKILIWDGNIDALGYSLKTNFVRRISTRTERFARGKFRSCKNTRADRLRAAERVELFQYLHSLGLEARLVLFGVIRSRYGFEVEP